MADRAIYATSPRHAGQDDAYAVADSVSRGIAQRGVLIASRQGVLDGSVVADTDVAGIVLQHAHIGRNGHLLGAGFGGDIGQQVAANKLKLKHLNQLL